MKPLDDTILEYFKVKSVQSIRYQTHNGVLFAIFITNRFRKIGWFAEFEGKYYGTFSKLQLKDKDDIIDYYLAIDKNAKDSIDSLCSNNATTKTVTANDRPSPYVGQ